MDGLTGFIGSTIAVTLTHPIDVFKTNYQVLRNSSTPMTAFGTIKHIYVMRGITGFLKGLPVSLTAQPVFWSVFYQTKSLNLKFSSDKAGNDIITNTVCGMIGSFIANPFYVLRTRFQVRDNTRTYLGMARDIYKKEGITKFFSGYPSSALNNLKLGIQIPLYDFFKDNKMNTFYSAGISKFVATTIFYPLDIIRTLQRNNPDKISIIQTANMIYKKNGIFGFYRGAMIYNMYSTPSFIILMYATDFLKKHFKN